MRGTSSLSRLTMEQPHFTTYNQEQHLYSTSNPHLFVFQTEDADSEVPYGGQTLPTSRGEPIYSAAVRVSGKDSQRRKMEAAHRISEKYASLQHSPESSSSNPEYDPLAVTEEDIQRLEVFFKGYRTQVWVCSTMANLYSEAGTTDSGSASWQLKFTGVPLLILDSGDVKSRNKRQLQLVLAEKGTGFALWKDVVDNLTSYRVQEAHFHTFYLSSDHRQRYGLSYNESEAAMTFHGYIDKLTSDPDNIALSIGKKKKKKQEKTREKPTKYKAPPKTDISLPCNFSHVTNVDPTDKKRFFSMQIFSRDPTPRPVRPQAIMGPQGVPQATEETPLKQKVIQV